MKFENPLSLSEVATFLNCESYGNKDVIIKGINEIHFVTNGDIIFVDNAKYFNKAINSDATVIIINEQISIPKGKAILVSDNPFRDFNKILNHHRPFVPSKELHHPTAKIGEKTIIQPNVFIGENVQIGKNCIIHPNVNLYANSIIGNSVEIHAGTTIGSAAFYFQKNKEGRFITFTSVGDVKIEDNVTIGASCTIDRGSTSTTFIGNGTKLDNQVHIGHDTIIEENCLIAAQTGIAGCSHIEKNVIIWGQVGIISDIHVGRDSVIMAQSGVSRNIKNNEVHFGTPAMPAREKLREIAFVRNLVNRKK